MASFEPEQLRRTRDVTLRLLKLFENVVTLRGFADFLQAAKAVHRTIENSSASAIEGDVTRVDADLRIHDDDALHQIAQLANIARPGILFEDAQSFLRQFLRLAAVGGGELFQE